MSLICLFCGKGSIFFKRIFLVFFFTGVFFIDFISLAQENEKKLGGAVDANYFTLVEEVMIPIPNEIFNILDKLGKPDWNKYLKYELCKKSRNRMQISLIFGKVVADGFLAVQAKDGEKVREVGKEVLVISRLLGVENEVKQHSQVIVDAVKGKNWEKIREEFDATQRSVQGGMKKLQDESLSQLISIGGWLRGLNIATAVIYDNYNSDEAELLNQKEMTKHFLNIIKKINAGQGQVNFALNKEIENILDIVYKMMDKNDKNLEKIQILKINKLTEQLLNKICQNEQKKNEN